MTEGGARIGNVLHPVADVAAAVEFYTATFGMPIKFVDATGTRPSTATGPPWPSPDRRRT